MSLAPSHLPGEVPSRDLPATLEGLLAFAVAATGGDAGAVYLTDEEHGDMALTVGHNLPDEALGHRLAPGEGLTGLVVEEGRTVLSDDVPRDPRARRRRPDWDAEPGVQAYLGLPLRTGSVVMGAIELTASQPRAFHVQRRGQAAIFADAAALLVEQIRLRTMTPPAPAGGEGAATESVGIMTVDAQLRVRTANAAMCRLLSMPLEAVVGRPVAALLPDLARPQARDVLDAALLGAPGTIAGVDVGRNAVDDEGGSRTLTVSAVPMAAPGASVPRGAMLVAHDVTDRARLEGELRSRHADAVDARDRLRQVIEVVSHELRTPLTSVLGYAQLLVERPDAEPEQAARWAEHIVDKARLMARLVADITDLSRLGSGRFELRTEPVDLAALLRRVAQDVETRHPEHEVTLIAEGQLPELELDPDRIEQVFTNLIGNAAKYWDAPGVIEVRTWAGPKSVRVDVIDAGPGVPEEIRDRLFEAFVRSDRGGGTGLGLTIAKGIAEAHGGSLAYAPNPDGGSIFAVTLPVGDGVSSR